MTFPVKEAVRWRRSVRTFNGAPLRAEDRAALEQYIQKQSNPFGVPVTFRLLDAKAHNLSSPVILGAEQYLAAKVSRGPRYELGFGYSFEQVCLFAASLGIGTVMLAASLSRETFEQAMELRGDEVLPVASPVGYPAEKKSLREALMRKGLKADERIPYETMFSHRRYGQPLTRTEAGVFAEALEMARWAPSAANRQPLRAVADGERVHFYEDKTLKDSPLGDVQKVDIGIALAHFDLTLREEGQSVRFFEDDPKLETPERVRYVISCQRDV